MEGWTQIEGTPPNPRWKKVWVVVAVFAGILISINTGGGGSTPSSGSRPTSPAPVSVGSIDAVGICHVAIKDVLKAPSTAQFQPMRESSVSRSGDRFEVRLWVDAQNSFGAMLRSDWDCVVTYQPGSRNWRVNSLTEQ